MAEIGLVASLVGIAGAAVQLTRTLYEFGSTASAAREQVDHVAKNVSFYSDLLELLIEQFDHDRPIHSTKAVVLAEKLYDHSCDLFDRIGDLIPRGRRNRDQISFLQRITWNFKKTKVDVLVGELESLKSTVQLLVQVLCAARQLRAYREDVRKPKEKKYRHSAVERQCLRAENVIIEWQRAQEILPTLQEAAEKDDIRLIQAQPGSTIPHESPKLGSSSSLVKNQETTLAVIEAAAAGAFDSKNEKRALILRNTDNWLNQLLGEWTVLSGEAPEIERDVNLNTQEELPHEDQFLAPNVETSERDGKDHRPTKAKSSEHVDDLDVRIKRAEEELAKERQEKRVSSLSGQPSTPTREYRDGRVYEEHQPNTSYFEEGYRYWKEKPRTTSRKYDGYEQARRPDFGQPEKERESSKWLDKAASELPSHTPKFKVKAPKTREAVKERTRQNEAHVSSANTRDRNQRRERMEKQSSRRAYVEESSSSDSDTATYVTINRPPPRTSRSTYDSPPRTKSKAEPKLQSPPQPPPSSISTNTPIDPDSPLGQMNALSSAFHTQWLTKCTQFIMDPPSDLNTRYLEYLKLCESVMTQILLKADSIEIEGDPDARAARKQLVDEASDVLKRLDAVGRGWS